MDGIEPDGPLRGRPKSAELDEALLEAACTVLARQGYRGFSFDAVARVAGTTRPAIYRRWANRQDLLLAALDHVMSVHSSDDEMTAGLAERSDAELRAIFARMVAAFARIVGDRRAAAVSISVSAAMYEDDALRTLTQTHHYDRRKPLEDILHLLGARGLLRSDVPVGDLIHMLVGAVQYRSNMLLEPLDDAFIANVVRLFLAPDVG